VRECKKKKGRVVEKMVKGRKDKREKGKEKGR